jgi:hypothetical protein
MLLNSGNGVRTEASRGPTSVRLSKSGNVRSARTDQMAHRPRNAVSGKRLSASLSRRKRTARDGSCSRDKFRNSAEKVAQGR